MRTRLGEGENASEIETRAAAFLAEARPIAELNDREIGVLRRRLLVDRQVRRRPYLLPAVAALAVLLAAGTVLAVVGGWRPRLPRFSGKSVAPAPVARPTQRPVARAARSVGRAPGALEEMTPSPSLPLLEEPMPPEPTPRRLEPATPSTRVDLRPTPAQAVAPMGRRSMHRELPAPTELPSPAEQPLPSAPVTVRDEGGPSSEARSLSEALARWRRDNDAEAALALLATHEHRFAQGAFAVEAKVARAEILLALGRRSQALVVLDSLSLATLPRARELQTVRGELRSQAGRCQEARDDLLRVLTENGSDELGQRAARVFAKCP